jgi:hypothetical protein
MDPWWKWVQYNYICRKEESMEKVTVEWISNILRMFPTDIQLGLLFDRMPFGMPAITMVPTENGSTMIVLNSEENKKRAIDFKLKHLQTSKDVGEVFYHISKPNRLQIFEIVSNMREFTDDDYNRILKNIWVSTEFPHQMAIPKLINLFGKAKPELFMDADEIEIYKNFPETITIYRGLMDKRAKVRGLSWTTDTTIATWFAKRFGGNNKVMQAEIRKNRIFAYINDRSEKEVVINPRGLKNVRAATEL